MVRSPAGESSPHVLLLFRQEIQRQARVVSWVRQGLARGEKILYATVPGDTLVPALRAGGREAAVALRHGQLSFVPAMEFFPGARQGEMVRRALEGGYPAVRMSARADDALGHESMDEYLAIDLLMHELCATLPVTVLCQLDVGVASSETVTTLISCHEGVVEDDQMRLVHRGGEVVLSGEVDFSAAGILSAALRRVCTLESASTTVIDLSGLAFADVAGCRALVVGSDEYRSAGGRVTFRGVNPHVHRVMTLLGMDRLAGIEVR